MFENVGKWGLVESIRDVMNWVEFDEVYVFVKVNNFFYKYYVFVWGN